MVAKNSKQLENVTKVGEGAAHRAYVKKETMMIVAFVALLVGFLSGAAFVSFKSGAAIPPANPARSQTAESLAKQVGPLEDEVSRNPSNLQAWIQLGNQYFDVNQYQQAIRAYERALALDQSHPDVWTDLGVMYRRNGQPKKAIEAFDKAIALDPLHEASRFNKGVVLMHDLNDQKGALAVWEELLVINPNAKTPDGHPLRGLIGRVNRSEP